MPIQLNEENNGEVLVIHVSDKLHKADYEKFVPEFERIASEHGKVRVLFDMTDFHGWDAAAIWGDARFGIHHFNDISKMAMVGEKRWQHSMAVLWKPLSKAPIRYFDRADAAEAMTWLNAA